MKLYILIKSVEFTIYEIFKKFIISAYLESETNC